MTPEALSPLLLLQNATTVPDAVRHAMDAIDAGASAAEAQQAIDGWVALQGQQVQRVFAGPSRRDCCTGIERQHLDVPQTADITDYLRAKGEL
jgi:hypothetical protein